MDESLDLRKMLKATYDAAVVAKDLAAQLKAIELLMKMGVAAGDVKLPRNYSGDVQNATGARNGSPPK